MTGGPDSTVYRRILVALDGSPAAEEALPHALIQARAFGAELILLQVIPTLLPVRPSAARDAEHASAADVDIENDDERAARVYLTAVVENMRAQGVTATSHIRRGPAVATILQEGQETNVDLMVLTTYGASLIPRLLAGAVGSVATQVVSRALCPILLVRPRGAMMEEGRTRSFDDAASHYGPLIQRPLGLRIVPIERIVGSVGRTGDLGATFLTHGSLQSKDRYRAIHQALERGDILPPVELYKLGYDYYVLDGNHRVAAARDLGQKEIDAVVIEFLPIDDAAAHRVYLERRAFEAATGLARIGATQPGHYARLQELIEQYATQEGIADLKEAAPRWYMRVYRPLAARLRSARLTRLFPGERTADLIVHLEDLRAGEERRLRHPVSREEALDTMLSRYRSIQRHTRLRVPGLSYLLGKKPQATLEDV